MGRFLACQQGPPAVGDNPSDQGMFSDGPAVLDLPQHPRDAGCVQLFPEFSSKSESPSCVTLTQMRCQEVTTQCTVMTGEPGRWIAWKHTLVKCPAGTDDENACADSAVERPSIVCGGCHGHTVTRCVGRAWRKYRGGVRVC